jgi:hypothetical protein
MQEAQAFSSIFLFAILLIARNFPNRLPSGMPYVDSHFAGIWLTG